MSEVSKFHERQQIGLSLYLFFIFVVVAILFYYFRDYLPPDFLDPGHIIFVALLLVFCLVLMNLSPGEKGSYLADYYPAELDRMAGSLQKQTDELIFRKMGREAYQQILMEDSLGMDGSCQGWLNREGFHADPEMRFLLLAKLSGSYIKEDQYKRAAEVLREALSLKPDNILLNLRLGEVYEALGAGMEAIQFYEIALKLAAPGELQGYLRNQISRVKTRGPRKAAPMPGLRYSGL